MATRISEVASEQQTHPSHSIDHLLKDARQKLLEERKDEVLNELLQRHVQLKCLLLLYRSKQPLVASHDANASSIVAELNDSTQRFSIDPESTHYKLAVTDLFVETALHRLNEKAIKYRKQGTGVYALSVAVLFIGLLVALLQLDAAVPTEWMALIAHFIRAITFYGFIVLSAVALWRFGRALLDQSERLFARRHALRQGRLYVHLTDAKTPIEQLEKAFAWNLTQANAFENLSTDAKAPWGAILAELIQGIAANVQSSNDPTHRNKKEDK